MKIQKEITNIPIGKSFRLFNPSLRNHFYWHYHPEIELVYVEAIAGIRHVGKNISSYEGSDLVLIGPNVPHLNFDYGLEVDYKQTVIQLKETFVTDLIANVSEFDAIRLLFDKSVMGLSFSGDTKQKAAAKFHDLSTADPVTAILGLIEIFSLLAASDEVEVLNSEDTRIKFFMNDKIRMGTIYDYIHKNYDQNIEVNTIASKVGMTSPAFCRYFKKQTDITFTEFVNKYRITQAKTLLIQDLDVSEVVFKVGLESSSYFNKIFKKNTGETPTEFKNRHREILKNS